ncbi:MAG: hypothetical protein PSX81_12950 [bacterium]|nr:hypothetical protein [bacterium]
MNLSSHQSLPSKLRTIGFIALSVLFLSACKENPVDPPKEEIPTDVVNLTFKFNSFLTGPFISSAGDTIAINKLKFLMSGFILEKTTGEFVVLPDAYGFLSLTERIDSFILKNVPKGEYKSVRFMVGIDSAINHANPQQWALTHPMNPSVNDMHWGWSGGYIFNVIEGYYKNNGFDKAFSFHVALDKNARRYSYVTNYTIIRNSTFTFNVDAQKYFSNVINFGLKTDGDFSHSGDPDPVMDKFMQNIGGVIDFTSFK